jgi:hypothetical protein
MHDFYRYKKNIYKTNQGFYIHWTYMYIFRHIFLSNYWWQRSGIWSEVSYRYPISWVSWTDGRTEGRTEVKQYTSSPFGERGYNNNKIMFIYLPIQNWGRRYTVLPLSVLPSFHPSKIFFVAFFSVTVDGRNLIFRHKLHIGIPYCG